MSLLSCPDCGQSLDAPADGFARNLTCPRCECLFRTRETADIQHASEGYKLDFVDFRKLLDDASPEALNATVFRVANLVLVRRAEGPAVYRTTGE